MGSGAAAITAGVGQAVYVDEYTSAAGQSGPVMSHQVVGSNVCTLSHAVSVPGTSTWLYDQEGVPLLATSGAFLMFPCYSSAIGSALAINSVKIGTVVSYTGATNTTTALTTSQASTAGTASYPQALRNIASNGEGNWWGLSSGYPGTVLMYVPRVGLKGYYFTACALSGTNTCLGCAAGYWFGSLGWGFGNGALMYTDNGPTSSYTVSFVMLRQCSVSEQ